jgi:uncharacterized protein (DUF2249 family)
MKPEIQYDVRPVLEEGGCPFDAIMNALDAVPSGYAFRLVCPFEPVPLIQALRQRGWEVSKREVVDECLHLTFTECQGSSDLNPLIMVNLTECSEPDMVKRLAVILRQVKPGRAMIAELAHDPAEWMATIDRARFEVELNCIAASRWELCVVRL